MHSQTRAPAVPHEITLVSSGTSTQTSEYALWPALLWQAATWWFGMLLLKAFGHIKVQGQEHLLHVKPGALFAANHASDIDGIVMLAGIGPLSAHFPVYYVAKPAKHYAISRFWDRMLYTPSFLTLVGAIAARKGSRDYAYALQNHVAILKSNKSVAIFPEGREHGAHEVFSTVHGGVAYLAEQTGAPIIPVWISGTYDITIASFFKRTHRISITYGPPIAISDVLHQTDSADIKYRNAAQRICDRILSLRTA